MDLEEGRLPASLAEATRLLDQATRMIIATVLRPGTAAMATASVLSAAPTGWIGLLAAADVIRAAELGVELGASLARAIGQLVSLGSLTVNHVDGERRVPVGQLTSLVSPIDRWLGVWIERGGILGVRLYRANRSLALRLVQDLVTTAIDPNEPEIVARLAEG